MDRWDVIGSNRDAGLFKLLLNIDRSDHADISRLHVELQVTVVLMSSARDGEADAAMSQIGLRLLSGNLRGRLGRV